MSSVRSGTTSLTLVHLRTWGYIMLGHANQQQLNFLRRVLFPQRKLACIAESFTRFATQRMRQLWKKEKNFLFIPKSSRISIRYVLAAKFIPGSQNDAPKCRGQRETEKEYTMIYACPHLYCATQILMNYSARHEETLRSNRSLVPHLDC